MNKFRMSAAEMSAKARKAALRFRRVENKLPIEGEYVTRKEIAARLGIDEKLVTQRMRVLRTKPGAITWEALRG